MGTQEIGKRGEEAVCMHIARMGGTVIDRNWRHGHLEIDIVALFEDGIHFVEVKSRTAPVQAEPQDNAGKAKMCRIAEAAGHYVREKDDERLGSMEVHIDVAAVTFDRADIRIEYFPDAHIPLFFGR